MGYMHIDNLYKNQDILLFKECWALEKVHGSSAHVTWHSENGGRLGFFVGGESHERFVAIFDKEKLFAAFAALGHANVMVHGEVYGGRCQGMSKVYGVELRFIAFDIRVGDSWLAVPDMASVAALLEFEVVPFRKVSTELTALDAERDRPSEVAERRGAGVQVREGVVLRPPVEVTKNNGERIIVKHKTEQFSERATPQKVIDPSKLLVLEGAAAIAEEWVTDMRLSHVLQKLPDAADMSAVPKVIAAMTDDVMREASGEIVDSREARAAIGKRTAKMFKMRLSATLRE